MDLSGRVWGSVVGFVLLTPFALLGGCSGTTPTTSSSPSTTAAASPAVQASGKFALILSGQPTDKSWDQQAYEAAQALKAKGVEVVVSESVPPADVDRLLRQYAEAGYSPIVAHSFNYGDAVFKVSKEFPNTNFAYAGGLGKVTENVADYDQPFYEGAYMVGQVAGKLSKTGKLGALYGFDIPVCHAMGEAMLAGAKTVNPKATLSSAAVGNWADVAKAKEAALSQAETGVDYWIGCGQGPTIGQIEAAKAKGGFATSYVGDMSSLGPNVVATNLLWDLQPLFEKMLQDTKDKKFAKQYYKPGVATGNVKVQVTDPFKSKVGDEVIKTLEATQAKIASGELKVPYVPK